MNASELRIGIYVQDLDNNMFEISHIEHMRCPEDLKPIPLTEKWLERLGFKMNIVHGERRYFGNDQLEVFEKDGVFESSEMIGLRIAYVHQLQNVYFVRSNGQELKLQEKPNKT